MTNLFAIKKNKKPLNRGQGIFLISMLVVPILHWMVFWLYVNLNSILLGFKATNGAWSFINFQNLFYELTSSNSTIMIAIKNTLIYFLNGLVIIMPLALFISYFLFKKILLSRVFRVVFFLPSIISAVALTTVFANFITPYGPLGVVLKALGMTEVPEFLASSKYATTTIVIYCIWTGFGTNILLFSGAMSRIPLEIIESAKLDGCGVAREMAQIILPLMWPTLSTMLIFQATGIFAASGPILLFTKGQYATTTIGYWIFDMVYNYNSYEMVSATGLFFTVVGVPIILFIKWLIEKVPTVEY